VCNFRLSFEERLSTGPTLLWVISGGTHPSAARQVNLNTDLSRDLMRGFLGADIIGMQ